MNYKKIIKSQELRFKILGLLDFLPDKTMIKIQYRIKTGRKLNLKKPKRFTEKLQWYKLFYRDPLMTQCADKFNVRKYIAGKGYDDILIPLYGVYENADEIGFKELPNEFVLKTTNGSHTNIICKDKRKLDIGKTIKTLNSWVKDRPIKLGREWAYYDIKPKIICEQLLKDDSNEFDGINDYKFICFNGKAQYVWIDVNRYVNHRRNFYDTEWNYIDVSTDVQNYGDTIPKPAGLNEMVSIANDLAKDFPHVRVDLYWLNNKVYFGELTFYLLSGYEDFEPEKFDFLLGEQFKLPEILNETGV
jgi:hypothetical protein